MISGADPNGLAALCNAIGELLGKGHRILQPKIAQRQAEVWAAIYQINLFGVVFQRERDRVFT